MELQVWGPAFGLPSGDAESLAAIAYLGYGLPRHSWVLVQGGIDMEGRLRLVLAFCTSESLTIDLVIHLLMYQLLIKGMM
jgi:hypothetical protein